MTAETALVLVVTVPQSPGAAINVSGMRLHKHHRVCHCHHHVVALDQARECCAATSQVSEACAGVRF